MSQQNDDSQITHVLNRIESNKQQNLTDHGQKLFNAINCLLDDHEQLELTQALFKYQREHNVFTLVRSCCELFDTPKKKSLMLFMRPVIPIKDRFHYDEYYKLFFPDEFSKDVKSIFSDLIPKDLLEKTLQKANEKKKLNQERIEKETNEYIEAIKVLEKNNFDLNLDLQKIMLSEKENSEKNSLDIDMLKKDSQAEPSSDKVNPVKIAGFRIIDLAPNEEESLGFDVCLGPTGTFIMVSYVEPNSIVEKYGMKIGDELVSVNEISFKMIDLEQAIEILSTEATLRIVLQTSGFMPESFDEKQSTLSETAFNNEWTTPFGKSISPPSESQSTLKHLVRRVTINPRVCKNFEVGIRGGIDYQLGVFISIINANFKTELKTSDQIIEVNDQTFSRISHAEAVRILQNSLADCVNRNAPIRLLVRYLGKIPVLKNVKNSTQSTSNEIGNSIDSVIKFSNKIISSRDTLTYSRDFLGFEKIISNLNMSTLEQNKLLYLFSEYQNSKINLEYFVYLVKVNFKKQLPISVLEELLKPQDSNEFKYLLDEFNSSISTNFISHFQINYKKNLKIKTTDSLNISLQEEAVLNHSLNRIYCKSLENINFV